MMHRDCPTSAQGGLAFPSLRGSKADLFFHGKYFKIVLHFKRKVQIAFLDLSDKSEENYICVCARSHTAHEHACAYANIRVHCVSTRMFVNLQVSKHIMCT